MSIDNDNVLFFYLKVDDDVVLARHVVGNVVIDNETEETIQEGEINLLVELVKGRLHENIALAIGRLPHVLQVVNG